ncbi:hypothetical protein U1Q18_049760 [Sarracenia purpurea var. burkii]
MKAKLIKRTIHLSSTSVSSGYGYNSTIGIFKRNDYEYITIKYLSAVGIVYFSSCKIVPIVYISSKFFAVIITQQNDSIAYGDIRTNFAANSISEYVPSKECGDPLILTPLIEKGEITAAKEKSYVTPLLPNIHSHSGYLTPGVVNSPSYTLVTRRSRVQLIFGLFTENGPFRIKHGKLVKSRFSWTKYYNVLYIDNPIGTGYSFGSYVDSEQELGKHLFDALTQFFTLFPELRKNKFFMSGESYAGKYIPVLGYEIYKRNPTQQFPINLKGLFIGNGLTDPENMNDYAEHLHRLGIIDHRQKLILQRDEEEARILIRNAEWRNASGMEFKVLRNIRKASNFTKLYDYIAEDFNGDDSYVEFMDDDDFRRNIHVGKVEYNECSHQAYRHS